MKYQRHESTARAAAPKGDPLLTPDSVLFGKPNEGIRERLYIIIFEADTRAGKLFDLSLIALILLSVAVVMLDSIGSVAGRYGVWLSALEWVFTGLFTIEYILRLYCVRHPLRYAKSFFGVIDLLSILPAYLAFFLPGAHALLDIRVLRLLRMFRILKLVNYVHEYRSLSLALAASKRKIFIFISFVAISVMLMGTLMYVVEGPENGYASIPTSIYWAITTVTTVGFGDITPTTPVGRFISSLMMLIGWGILAVPTGIISAEMTAQRTRRLPTTRTCPECLSEGHDPDANYCLNCGARLPPYHYG